MLDPLARRLIDPPLARVARLLVRRGVRANQVTVTGFAIGMLAVPLLAFGLYGAALVPILANRVLDGVDGAVARERGVTDFGGYLDAVCDFIFYSAVVFGFALGNSDHAVYAAFLILCFMGTGSTFLTFAALAARRGLATEQRGKKSLYYLGGLTEGTETIAAFALFCLFPAWFPVWAVGFGTLCGVTTITRIAVARQTLSADENAAHERSEGPGHERSDGDGGELRPYVK